MTSMEKQTPFNKGKSAYDYRHLNNSKIAAFNKHGIHRQRLLSNQTHSD